MIPAERWMTRGACRGADPDLFDSMGPYDPQKTLIPGSARDRALRICAECPVMMECRQYGTRHQTSGVIQGGMEYTGSRARDLRIYIVCPVEDCRTIYRTRAGSPAPACWEHCDD